MFNKIKRLFQKKPTKVLYRKITVAESTGNLNEVFGISLERYKEMGRYVAPMVRKMLIEGTSYSSLIDKIFTDPFFKTEQEQILQVFQVGRLIGAMQEGQQKSFAPGFLDELLATVVKGAKSVVEGKDEELERIKKENPEIVEETNCGSPTCKVHGHLNKKKTRSSRPVN